MNEKITKQSFSYFTPLYIARHWLQCKRILELALSLHKTCMAFVQWKLQFQEYHSGRESILAVTKSTHKPWKRAFATYSLFTVTNKSATSTHDGKVPAKLLFTTYKQCEECYKPNLPWLATNVSKLFFEIHFYFIKWQKLISNAENNPHTVQ